ncbi:hypothetical protein BO83DRAFT_77385 [Aspergillus eucalypticola CBS 122712]|uniref:Secreted protein n=1 Tax=Aspergillus eucalypticola (strain CBS 122712 / IBT 29274) TaxID=1448314 RepID=A0A317WFY2_ASPEC|nr:uncharacterized protein BO83DRAFT_77385 [Aspergillus eucalypticola CBS 122712]PWY83938.1 hypothetical protein BO83DRAFT_77385 [Aspergillus eucalypticola CBS 122712]
MRIIFVVVVLCVAETYCRGFQLQCGQLPELELSHGNQPKGPVTTSSPEEVDFETNMWHNSIHGHDSTASPVWSSSFRPPPNSNLPNAVEYYSVWDNHAKYFNCSKEP